MSGQEPGPQPTRRPAWTAVLAAWTARRPAWTARLRAWTARLHGMRRTSKIALASAVGLLALVTVVSLAGGTGNAKPKPPLAKDFTLQELGHPGHRVSLTAFSGQPVIVNFFASWCAPCKRETPLLARFYREMKGRVIVIGVDSGDQAGPAMRFLRAAGVRYPVGFDPLPSSATTSYGVYGLPQTFFLNAQHRIVRRVLGALTMRELTAGTDLMDGHAKSLAASAAGQGRG
jgi:thiol-disulfide isomerase/thioredoxin